MARPLRIELPGALSHVTSRGNSRDIDLDDSDRQTFLDVWGEVCGRVQWVCHASCLMTNPSHLVFKTPAGNLAQGMCHVHGGYTQRFHRHHDRQSGSQGQRAKGNQSGLRV